MYRPARHHLQHTSLRCVFPCVCVCACVCAPHTTNTSLIMYTFGYSKYTPPAAFPAVLFTYTLSCMVTGPSVRRKCAAPPLILAEFDWGTHTYTHTHTDCGPCLAACMREYGWEAGQTCRGVCAAGQTHGVPTAQAGTCACTGRTACDDKATATNVCNTMCEYWTDCM